MSDYPLFDMLDPHESQQQSEHGQARVATKNAEAIAEIQRAFLWHLRDIAPKHGSLDTLRDSGFVLPQTTHANAVGSAIGSLSRRGLIVCVGVARGQLPRAHLGKMFMWRPAERGRPQ